MVDRRRGTTAGACLCTIADIGTRAPDAAMAR